MEWFKKHKIISIILGLIILSTVGAAIGGSNTSNNDNKPTENVSSNNEPETAKIGQAARDGKFEFTVSKLKCGETKIGDQYLNEKAQGEFCRLSLTIKNIGDEAQSLFSGDQKLVNSKGQEFAADDTATIYASSGGSGSTWFDEINPGNSVKGDIIFDVPKDTKIVAAELHDSAFSGGVKVNLR